MSEQPRPSERTDDVEGHAYRRDVASPEQPQDVDAHGFRFRRGDELPTEKPTGAEPRDDGDAHEGRVDA